MYSGVLWLTGDKWLGLLVGTAVTAVETDQGVVGCEQLVIAVGPWVKVPDYAMATSEINQSILEAFRRGSIPAPVPQRDGSSISMGAPKAQNSGAFMSWPPAIMMACDATVT